MTDQKHFHNFTPADAVQYDGEHGDEALFDVVRSEIRWGGQEGWPIRKGQWLVRQGSKVWVQDDEPARVERWELGTDDINWTPPWGPRMNKHRPIVRTPDGSLWTGPWMPVEGGAE